MKQIKTQINIAASPEQVWQVLMDFESYPKWNPFVKSIQGTAKLQNQLIVDVQPHDMKPQQFKPLVTSLQENKVFSWKGKLFMSGLFDGEHYFKLVPDGQNTQFIHGEKFTGILVPIIMSMIEDKTLKGFEAMNIALKEKVESLAKKQTGVNPV